MRKLKLQNTFIKKMEATELTSVTTTEGTRKALESRNRKSSY